MTMSIWTDMLSSTVAQRGGEAGVAGEVVDRNAEDVGAHVRHADAGGQVEPDLVSALRVEEGAEASDRREEEGASCRRHLEHSRIIPPRKIQAG